MPQQYDGYLKSIALDDPRALYQLLQRPPPPPDAVIQPIAQELASKKIILDCGFLVESNGQKHVDIFEFKAQYSNSARKQVLDYALMVYLDRNLPVECTLAIVYPDQFPKSYTELPPLETPGLLSIRFQTVKLWDVDAASVLSWDRPNLLSVLPLLRASRQEMVEGARRVFQKGTEEARSWFWTFVKIRYDETGVSLLLEESQMNAAIMEKLVKELYPFSPMGKRERQEGRDEGREEGLEKGLKKGLEKGRLTEATDTLRRLLTRRFPTYQIPAAFSSIASLDALRAAEDELFDSTSVSDAEQIISRLLSQNPV